jgi:hypothetical protein
LDRRIGGIMKYLLLLASIFIFNGCLPTSSSNGESISTNTESKCNNEFGTLDYKLKQCGLYDEVKSHKNTLECYIYDGNYNYTEQELVENDNCAKNIDSLSCDTLETITDIGEIEGCPTFRDKPKKSKKMACAENYFIFCDYQLSFCGESSLDSKCTEAKYTETNSSGLDAHTSFKMDKLLEFCDSEGSEDADMNDLDCILRGNYVISYDVCETPVFSEFRASCSWFEE